MNRRLQTGLAAVALLVVVCVVGPVIRSDPPRDPLHAATLHAITPSTTPCSPTLTSRAVSVTVVCPWARLIPVNRAISSPPTMIPLTIRCQIRIPDSSLV